MERSIILHVQLYEKRTFVSSIVYRGLETKLCCMWLLMTWLIYDDSIEYDIIVGQL